MNKCKNEMDILIAVPVLTLLVTSSSPSPAPADVCTGASRYFVSLNGVLTSSYHSCSEVINPGLNR